MNPWSLLVRAYADKKLSHALMLTGGTPESRRSFARRFTGLLLCETQQQASSERDVAACGACRGCLQLAAEVHPNLIYLTPEEGKRDIGIESLRVAMDRLSFSSHYGGRKVLILDPVDRLNFNGRDALLKTLEEPPADSHLILSVERLMSLPATLRSRCQIVRLPKPLPAELDGSAVSAVLDLVSQGRVQEPLAQLQSLKLSREEWAQLGSELAQRLHQAMQASLLKEDRDSFKWAQSRQLAAWYQQSIEFLRALASNANAQLLIESLMIKIWQSRAGRGHV